MTEQYIYSRSEREFVNALDQTIPLGFGFMALSPGMDNSLKRDVSVHCEDCPRLSQTDSQGVSLPLFRKTCLPKGQVLLQKSTWIEKGSRDFHVAHGYVLDDEAVKSAGPAGWLGAAFRLEDPNTVPGGIPPLKSRLELSKQKPLEFCSLKDAALGLNSERFCQMLLACFDALASRRQVLIAWDFERPQEQDLRCSILYWIYTCLPYDLWTHLGFDSVYTDKSSPGLVQLAFVDVASIRDGGQTPSIQLENQLVPLGGNFLIRDREIIHNDGKYKTDWYRKNSPYAKWLRQLVDIVWKCPEEKRGAVIQELGNVRRSLQRHMPSKAEGKRLDPNDHNIACRTINDLRDLKKAAGLEKPARPAVKCTAPPKEHEPSSADVYQRILQRCKQQPSPKDLKDLAGIRGENKSAAIELLSAFMAREADAPGASMFAVLRKYQEQLPSNVYAQLPCRIFWYESSVVDQVVWTKCDVKSGDDAAKRRRFQCYTEIVAVYMRTAYNLKTNLTSYLRNFLNGLPGVSDERRDSMEKECFVMWVKCISKRHNILWGRHNLDYPTDIQLLASMCSNESVGSYMMGHLGAFMVQATDAQGMLWALSSYQQLLLWQPSVYSQLLCRLFCNKMTDTERGIWNSWHVENSDDAASSRRTKWCNEIARTYNHWAEDLTSFVKSRLYTLSGIDEECRIDMEKKLQEELQKIVKGYLGASVNGGSGV